MEPNLTFFIGRRENSCTCIDAYSDPQLGVMFVFQCDCGHVYKERYRAGRTICRECNPINRPTYPPSLRKRFKREFNSWSDMMSRCYRPAHKKYHRYGGRGISVCDRWHKFDYFLEDMGERPHNTTIERLLLMVGDYQFQNGHAFIVLRKRLSIDASKMAGNLKIY